MAMSAFDDELKTIKRLRRMGATHIELPLIKVTFPEAPIVQPIKRLRVPKVVAQELKNAGIDIAPEHDELELARQEMDSFLRDTVG